MTIKAYLHNDPVLLQHIAFLLGSDEWQQEHLQSLRRQDGKVFYLLFDDTMKFVSMCSIYKHQILDVHTLPSHRGKGYATYLISHIALPLMYAGSSNHKMQYILEHIGFVYYLSRGKYWYYRKET